jgi:hypothetical protein
LSGGAPYADPNWHLWMNANLLKLSTLFTLRVLSRVTSLPVSPTDGDIYIVPDGDANEKTVAVRDNGAWTYISAFSGLVAYVIDEDADYAFDGTNWAAVGSVGGVTTFLGLSDTPANFTGAANKKVAVNNTGTALEFVSGGKFSSINSQVGTTYTAVLADADDVLITLDNAAAIAFTIPAEASVTYPIGTTLQWLQLGAGLVTATPDTGVTLLSRGSVFGTGGQYAIASAVKIASDTWIVTGDIA